MGPGPDDYDDLPPLRGIVVPDDARELEQDRLAWLREQRALRRRARWARLPARWGHRQAAAPLLVMVLVAAVAFAGLSILVAPGPIAPPPAPAPLAVTSAAPGALGGLLPDASAGSLRGPVALRSLRPGVLALVPAGCACRAALETAFRQAAEYRLPLWALTTAGEAKTVQETVSRIGNGTVPTLTADAAVTASYRPDGLTLLLVRADGVVTDVLRRAGAGLHAEPELAMLDRAPSTQTISPVR